MPSVILSGDHARTGNRRLPRRNLGRGEPPLSPAGSPQNAKMPNKLVEYVAAPFPLTLSLSKGERSHNLPLMVRQAHHERVGVACAVGAARTPRSSPNSTLRNMR